MITCGALSNWHLISQRLQAKPRLRVFHVIVYSKLLFQPWGFIKAECQSRHFLIKARFMHKRVNTRVKLRVSSTVPCYQLLQSVSLSHDRSNLSFSSWSLLKSSPRSLFELKRLIHANPMWISSLWFAQHLSSLCFACSFTDWTINNTDL